MKWHYPCSSHLASKDEDVILLSELCEHATARTVAEISIKGYPGLNSIAVRIDVFTYKEGKVAFDYLYNFTINYRCEEKFSRLGTVHPFFIRKLEKRSDDDLWEEYCSDGDYRVAIQVACRDQNERNMEEVEEDLRQQFKKVLHISMIGTQFIMAK